MLPKIKTILYATDLSPNSAFAYRYALSCAEKYDAMISILHIVEDVGPYAHAMLKAHLPELSTKKIIEGYIQEITERLQVFCDENVSEIPSCRMRVSSIMVYEGDPVREILRQVKKLTADLVIMGTHGKGSSLSPFFGSVAKRIVGLSRVPVLLIPIRDIDGPSL